MAVAEFRGFNSLAEWPGMGEHDELHRRFRVMVGVSVKLIVDVMELMVRVVLGRLRIVREVLGPGLSTSKDEEAEKKKNRSLEFHRRWHLPDLIMSRLLASETVSQRPEFLLFSI
jgi:hypothetical protein